MSRHLVHPLPENNNTHEGDILWRNGKPWEVLEVEEDKAIITKVETERLQAPQSRGLPTVTHTTHITCAKCGSTSTLNNGEKQDATTLRLPDGGRLYFHCSSCGDIYPLPYMKQR